MAGEGLEPTTTHFLAGCDNHYITLPTVVWHNAYQALGSTLLTSILLYDYITIQQTGVQAPICPNIFNFPYIIQTLKLIFLWNMKYTGERGRDPHHTDALYTIYTLNVVLSK